MADKTNEKKKGKAGKVVLFLIIVALIALLLLYFGRGGGFGLGSGGTVPANGTTPADAATAESVSQEETTAQTGESDPSEIIIAVSEETILVNGKTVENADALREYLLSIDSEEKTYVLRDDHALKAVYDSVKEVMAGLGKEYAEESAN